MDLIQYGQLYNDAMAGMDTLFDDMKGSMKSFNKKKYPGFFENMMKKYGRVFICIEEVYNYESNKEKWLNKLAERFVGYAQNMIQSEKRKFKRDNMQIDCNIFVVSYVVPAILGYKGNMSEPFAQILLDCWNETFGTQMQSGDYETILGGFNTSIFGINFGKQEDYI